MTVCIERGAAAIEIDFILCYTLSIIVVIPFILYHYLIIFFSLFPLHPALADRAHYRNCHLSFVTGESGKGSDKT